MTEHSQTCPATLAEALPLQARTRPDAVLFEATGADGTETRLTYAEAHRQVEALAARLAALGVASGDRVAVRLPKTVEAMLLFFAVLRAGAVYVPINPDFTAREAEVLISDSEPALVVDNDGIETGALRRASFGTGRGDDLVSVAPGPAPAMPGADDGAVMLFTSGTTGRPKGAPLTHANMLTNMLALSSAWKIGPKDRLLHVLPVFHAHGLFLGIMMPALRGSTIRMLTKFTAEEAVAHLPGCTMLMAVPAIYTRLLDHPGFTREVCAGLRLATSGSAPLSPEVFEALKARMGMPVVERYGATETCIIATNPIDGTARVGSVGRPLSCVDLRIAGEDGAVLSQGEVGRVQVRGPSILTHYWNKPDRGTDWTDDGWFDTGDMGQVDADGFLWLVGRKKDLIISGGFNVYPREVEIELESLDGVAEAVVFGVPHPDFGEGVMAAVRPEKDRVVDVSRLEALLGEGLAKYKRPKRILVMEDFPRNQMGKVLKAELRQTHADTFATVK